MNKALENDIRNSPVIVHPGRYAYLKMSTFPEEKKVFMITRDDDEITVVAEEHELKHLGYQEDTKWFKLIEIQTASPFMVPGFIATITSAIASKGLTVLVVSTYSKDYFLVHEERLDVACDALRSIGFTLKT